MKTGAAKIDITPRDKLPLPLLGWGDPRHIAVSITTPIYSRAVAFEDSKGNRLVYVCVEICFISESLRLGVMDALEKSETEYQFKEREIVITATHTHNAPGGYCHSILYNVPSKGYYPEIYSLYVSGIVQSIKEAWASRRSARIKGGSVEIPPEEEVAFNRALNAYNQNFDVSRVPSNHPEWALYRVMDGLAAYDETGSLIAYINWFSVHCTSIHRDFHSIHSDHKGLAAAALEREFVNEEASMAFQPVVVFAQGAAGDVSPNFKKFFLLREVRGKFREDHKSAEFNSEIQARYARRLLDEASDLSFSVDGAVAIDSIFAYHDFTSIPIPSSWIQGKKATSTAPAALGCPFMSGTAEGRGASPISVGFLTLILRLVYFFKGRSLYRSAHGNKVICIELSNARIFGDSNPEDLPIPGWLDPLMRVIRFWSRIRLFRGEEMSPSRMPVQLFRIGSFGFAAVPGEFTTQSGQRLRNLLLPLLKNKGIDRIVIAGYANSYAGYVTTEEEYQVQGYEGACTHFGKYTLLGYQAVFRRLAEKWTRTPLSDPGIRETLRPEMKPASVLKKLALKEKA